MRLTTVFFRGGLSEPKAGSAKQPIPRSFPQTHLSIRGFSILLIAISLLFAAASINAQTYSGQAFVAKTTISALGQPAFTTGVEDTGDLPSAGGNITLNTVGVTVPGALGIPPPLSVGLSTSSTSGVGGLSQSSASVANPNINILAGALTIAASAIGSNTNAGTCPSTTVTAGGAVTGLLINGVPITIAGDPNEIVVLPSIPGIASASLIVNQQTSSLRSITRNGLHLTVTLTTGVTIDVIVASSSSGIDCGPAPASNIFRGRATALFVRQDPTDLSAILADTGWLPTSGASITASTAAVVLDDTVLSSVNVTTGAVSSATSGGVAPSTTMSDDSSSTVNDLDVVLLPALAPDPVTLNADILESTTHCQCAVTGVSTCTATSQVTGLTVSVLGTPFPLPPITGAPQVIPINVLGLGSVTLTLNGRESSGPDNITAYPLRLQTSLTGLVATDIIAARSHSAISCAAPTAAPVFLAGRVTDANGYGLSRAAVKVTGMDGIGRSVLTNNFGYYTLNDLSAGESYLVSVSSKRYSFTPRVVTLLDNVSGFDFSPEIQKTPDSSDTKDP